MDIGLHIPESNPGNENTCLSQRELGSTQYCKTMSFHQNMRSASEQMLSFSSDKPEAFDFTKFVGLDNNNNNNKTSFSPFLHQIPSSYCKNSGGYGYGYGGLMNTSLTGVKGPFTLTQWAELEQQALIYKYITANVPVPSSLLLSIKKAFYPYGSLPPNSFGWGGFHLGFSGGNMDPEPGRCRRTDGKKWRCSRDAVPDQKYCERHINRGRHRSRKPVEGHSGHTLSSKIVKPPPPPIAAIAAAHQQPNLPADSITNRVRNSRGSSIYPTTINTQQQTKESPPLPLPLPLSLPHHQKQRNIEFGHISSDSLLNPSHKPSSLSSSYLDFTNNTTQQDHLKSDWTQLSISTPHQHHNNNNNNNNNNNKLLLSPLRLSREFDDETTTTLEPTNWIPISWGNSNSLGGPLGEVLNSTTNSPTGVLQKSTFCSLSNSSSASSPVCGGGGGGGGGTENNKNNGDDQIGSSGNGSTLVSSSSSVCVERNGNHFHFAS